VQRLCSINGKKVKGYLEESGVRANSKTETFVAAKLFIDNWRWQGMNFSYKSVFLVDMPQAYQRLLLDCMVGDQTPFYETG